MHQNSKQKEKVMALNTAKKGATGARGQSSAAAATGEAGVVHGVNGLVSLFGSVIPQSTSAGALNAYTETMRKILAALPEAKSVQIIPVDKSVAQMSVSVIAVVQVVGRSAAVFNYVVEATAGQIQPEEFKQPGRPDIQLPRAPGALYNFSETLWARVKASVEKVVDGVDEILDAGGAQLHKELDPSDAARIQQTLNRALNATDSMLSKAEPMNLAALQGLAMDVKAEFPRSNVEDSQGLPVYAAFKVDINGRDTSATNYDPVSVSATQISTLTGYVDLQYSGPTSIPGPNGALIQSTQMFVPKLVMTSTTTQHPRIFPELQLLAMACSAALVNRNSWMAALEPAFNDDGLHSLAGMGLELGAVVDPTDANFKLFDFLNSTVHLGSLNYYIHVADADDLTWLMAMFRDSTQAGELGTQAYNHIIQVANNLTNQVFGQIFQGGAIVEREDDKVIMGYWMDRQGNRRDLREINQIAFANLVGAADAAKAFEFNDTFNPEKGDLPIRLANRLALLREVLQGNLEFKGYAAPYRVNPAFIEALYTAVQQVGIPMNLNQYENGYAAVSRVNTSVMAAGINQQALATGWSSGRVGGTAQLNSNFRGAGTGRYGR